MREWVKEYAGLQENDADTAEVLLEMLTDFDGPACTALGRAGWSRMRSRRDCAA